MQVHTHAHTHADKYTHIMTSGVSVLHKSSDESPLPRTTDIVQPCTVLDHRHTDISNYKVLDAEDISQNFQPGNSVLHRPSDYLLSPRQWRSQRTFSRDGRMELEHVRTDFRIHSDDEGKRQCESSPLEKAKDTHLYLYSTSLCS